ncbi:ubiquinol oxidase subunit II, cyanide insensitive [Iodidimonas nitroreducens]|uniref:Ubiquinol oxidase subunit II, cyanide insensitive n=1 Tax=Iodidimonas nitroreducens TaxID=1236968 RepID=A0A5A7N991_9PROT|nr:cytochrome d ubiquinol oxidase subunit II [Iodidimonas nitroreducens]GAK33219.1 cytochrome bd-I ubiquinol oxidase subunit 2 [alpha proteobacterium Q-1]GER04334.1 ubiquinol oxidase subunit II, cyanide insensitive [Iodidimonas nitroreducens]
MIDLTMIWAAIIGFAIIAYVVMDGFDLGIGILFPFFEIGEDRDRAMNSIAPVWDGNETWLVMGVGGLLAAFPLAYAIILPALYAPMIAMLLGLVFRGVAFEFRWRDPGHRAFWDFAFTAGSFIATFAQGLALGALLQGISVENRAYAGGWWEWLSPFSVLTGFGLVVGYSLLGACWLNWKTEGNLQRQAVIYAGRLGIALLLLIGAISLVTLTLEQRYHARWLDFPGVLATAQVPLLTVIATWLFYRSLRLRKDIQPFLWALALFGLCLLGLGISIWPDVIPTRVTIWEAAAPHRSQVFMLVGASIMVPIILAYTAWSYWVFRGKVGKDGYH